MTATFPAYQPATGCTYAGPGAKNFLYWADRESPWADVVYNLGVCNCLAGETPVLTRDGWRPIAELAGTDVELLTVDTPGRSGRWVEAPIKSFGVQPLMRVTLSRDGRTRVVHATAGHRWFASRGRDRNPVHEVVTSDLTPGMRLVSTLPQSTATRTSPSPVGVQAGLIFGDGTKMSHDSRIMLCGEKNEALLAWFSDGQPRFKSDVGTLVTGLPRSFKDVPSFDEGTSYLYGWLAGYFAADGTVRQGGTPILYSAKAEHLEFVRVLALRLGIATREVVGRKRQGYGDDPSMLYEVSFDPRTLDSDFFLIPAHREHWNSADRRQASRWKVESVDRTDRVEEVFCAVVDGSERFVIDEFILTGNCRTVAGKKVRSLHGECRACDLGIPTVDGRANPIGHQIVQALLPHVAALGIQTIIFDRTIWSAKHPNGTPYTGVSPHYNHIHIDFTRAAAKHLNVPTVRAVMAGATPGPSNPSDPTEDDEMADKLYFLDSGAVWYAKGDGALRTPVESAREIDIFNFVLTRKGGVVDLRGNAEGSKLWLDHTVDARNVDLSRFYAEDNNNKLKSASGKLDGLNLAVRDARTALDKVGAAVVKIAASMGVKL